MAVTIQDDMAEVMEMLPESQQGDFARAIVLFGCRGLDPSKSAPWYPLFHAFRSRLELSSHMRQLGKKGNETRWNKTPDVSASIAEEANQAEYATIADEEQNATPASVLRRDENRREEMSTGKKRLGEEREEEKEKEKIKKKKNEKETREESGEGVSDGNVAGASPTERLVEAWTFGGRDKGWR